MNSPNEPKGPLKPVVVMAAKSTEPEMVTLSQKQLDVILAAQAQAEGHRRESEKLAMFLRERYYLEINDKATQHQGTAVDAAIHYMSIERSAWRVRLRYLLAAVARMGR